MELHYWGIRARNYAIMAIAQAGKVSITEYNETNLDALKPSLPFGQVPYLVDGDVKFAQSGAIMRYVARKAGLLGESDADVAMSEMLIEEHQDVYMMLARALYAPEGKDEGFAKVFAEGGPIRTHLGYLEKLIKGTTFCSKALAGDYAIAAALDMVVHLEPTILSGFPKLAAFLAMMLASLAFDRIKDYPMYFQR